MATGQVEFGDLVTVDYSPGISKMIFLKHEHGALMQNLKGARAALDRLATSVGSLNASRAVACPAE